MDRVHYTGHSVVTGTAIAHALLDYAQALSQEGTSATVEIPTIGDDGSPGRSEILIGPASQLMSDGEESVYPEVVDDDVVAWMRQEADRIRQHGAKSVTAKTADAEPADGWTDFDL